jgi:hypothetical protein
MPVWHPCPAVPPCPSARDWEEGALPATGARCSVARAGQDNFSGSQRPICALDGSQWRFQPPPMRLGVNSWRQPGECGVGTGQEIKNWLITPQIQNKARSFLLSPAWHVPLRGSRLPYPVGRWALRVPAVEPGVLRPPAHRGWRLVQAPRRWAPRGLGVSNLPGLDHSPASGLRGVFLSQ